MILIESLILRILNNLEDKCKYNSYYLAFSKYLLQIIQKTSPHFSYYVLLHPPTCKLFDPKKTLKMLIFKI